jgi:hypothetical protein
MAKRTERKDEEKVKNRVKTRNISKALTTSRVYPTESEILLRKAFEELHFPVITDNVYCFKCGNHYPADKPPDNCYICGITWKEGDSALPDIILKWYRWNSIADKMDITTGVIRVDGYEMHTRNRKRINKDYWQVQSFRDHKIRVFIVYNHEIEDPKERLAFARRVIGYMEGDDALYEEYYRSKEMKERVKRI